MNHAQLRAFHLVAREGSFVRAARVAGVGQPTLSAQVKALERTYDVRLFERRGRGTQLTDLGRRLYAVTDRLFALQGDAEALLGGAKTLAVGQIRISADNVFHAIPIMGELKRRHGGMRLSVRIGNSEAVLRDLVEFQADVGVTAKRPPEPPFHVLPYRSDRLVLFVPHGHDWAERRAVGMAELAGRDMVLREPGSVTREEFERARIDAEIELGEVLYVESSAAVQEAVAAGFGMGVAFARELAHDARFALLPVSDAGLSVGEYVVCLAERRHLAGVRAFLRIAAALAD